LWRTVLDDVLLRRNVRLVRTGTSQISIAETELSFPKVAMVIAAVEERLARSSGSPPKPWKPSNGRRFAPCAGRRI
jgi:hypothetical protein